MTSDQWITRGYWHTVCQVFWWVSRSEEKSWSKLQGLSEWVAQKRGDWRKKMWRWGGKKGHPRVGQAMWMLEKEGGTWEMTLKKQFFGNFKLLSRLVLDTFVAPTLKGHPHQPTFMPLSIWTSDSNTYWQIELWITGKEYFLEFLTQVLQVLHAIAYTQRNEQLSPS